MYPGLLSYVYILVYVQHVIYKCNQQVTMSHIYISKRESETGAQGESGGGDSYASHVSVIHVYAACNVRRVPHIALIGTHTHTLLVYKYTRYNRVVSGF